MKKIIIWSLTFLFTLTGVRAHADTPALSTFMSLSAQADPHTGSANFAIPIQVTPGRGGIEPNLALGYNSSMPNGMIGVGWGLEIGSITRSTKSGTPSYNNSTDKFILIQNGSAQELVYDSAAAIYRPEIEGAFMRIEFVNGCWIVKDRNGVSYYFGTTDLTREYNPSNSTKVFSWKLEKVVDLHGNTMTFTYLRDSNVLYPQLIEYTSNPGQSLSNFAKVEFTYENRPDDTAVKYSSGFAMTLKKRLKKVVVKAADTIQRRYDLAYDQSPVTQRSLLTSVTQVGNTQETALPPVTFTYQDDAINFNMASLPGSLPSGNKLWTANMAGGYDRGHDNYGPIPPYTSGQVGFGPLSWSGQQVAASGNWNGGADGSWSTTANGSLTVTVKKDHAYHFSTYVYVNQATTLTVNSIPNAGSIEPIGVWINGAYNQMAGKTWNLSAGLNLIDLTLYHQHADFTFNLNFDLANSVAVMNGKAPAAAQIAADFNADTLADLAFVDTATGKLKVSLSACLNFQPETEWLSGIGVDDKIVPADYNSDGRTDILVYRKTSNSFQMYFSNGTELTDQGTWVSNFGAPIPSNQPFSVQYAAAEYNGDGRPDLILLRNDGINLWVEVGINTGTSFNITQVTDYNIGTPSQAAYIGDVNGDGLMDYIINTSSTGEWKTHINPGGINVHPWIVGPPNTNFGAGYTPLIADYNGDGLTDIGYYKYQDGKVNYRKSNGQQYLYDETLPLTSSITGINSQVVPADFNGDTKLDMMFTNTATGADEIFYSNSKAPDLLDTAENGIGGVTTIAYGTAHVCNCSYLPFPIQVVYSVTASNGLGDSYTTSYEYMVATWDAEDREFRGFSKVRVIDAEGNYSETDYLTDDIYKGRPSEQRAYDADDNLFSKTVHTWDKQTIISGVDFVYLKRKDNFVYDGDADGRRTAEEFFYPESPQYGNLMKAVQLGEVNLTTGADIGTDSRTVETAYAKNTAADKWILGLPKAVVVRDHAQNQVRGTVFYYDGSPNNDTNPVKGLLTKKLEDGPGASDPSTLYAYDAVGNLLNTTDPLGRVTSLAYDSTYKLFPLTTTNALSHQVVNEYYGVNGISQDSGDGFKGLWGQLKSTTDPNNKTGKSVYDEFGRPVKSISPLDSLAYPTVITEYETDTTHSSVTAKQRINHGQAETIDAVQVYDGLGRLALSRQKSETQGTYVISGQTQYNSRGLPEKQYLPRFSTNPNPSIDTNLPHTTTEYDAMGRTVEVTSPDGTYASMAYDDWTTISIDPNGRKSESDYDAYGRLKTKREYSGADGRFASVYPLSAYSVYATTQYAYDSEGNLTQTTDADGNITTITYDSLGRKISMDDPDMNVWSYEYDLNGNLTKQTDAEGQVIDFTYDVLNRLVNKTDHAGLDVDYTYDDVNTPNSKGRLSYVQYGGSNDQTAFEYDSLGRESASTKTIGTSDYDVDRAYDALSRLNSVIYPDGNDVHYSYNAAGQIEQASSDPTLLTQQNPWSDSGSSNNPDPNIRLQMMYDDNPPLTFTYNAYRYYRLYITGTSGGVYAQVKELELFEPNGTTDITTGKTASADSEYGSSNTAAKAIDNSSTTFWSAVTTGSLPRWLKVDLGAGGAKAVGSYTISPRTADANAKPTAWKLQGSNDNSTWTDLDTRSGQTWANDNPVTFTFTAQGAFSGTAADATVRHTSVTPNGHVHIDNLFNPFGFESLAMDGNGDYLTMPDHADWDVLASATEDWTIDLWTQITNLTGTKTFLSQYQDANNYWYLGYRAGDGIVFEAKAGGVMKVALKGGSLTNDEFYHVVLAKVGDKYGLYLNGLQVGYAQTSNTMNIAGTMYVGSQNATANFMQGYLYAIRVMKDNLYEANPNYYTVSGVPVIDWMDQASSLTGNAAGEWTMVYQPSYVLNRIKDNSQSTFWSRECEDPDGNNCQSYAINAVFNDTIQTVNSLDLNTYYNRSGGGSYSATRKVELKANGAWTTVSEVTANSPNGLGGTLALNGPWNYVTEMKITFSGTAGLSALRLGFYEVSVNGPKSDTFYMDDAIVGPGGPWEYLLSSAKPDIDEANFAITSLMDRHPERSEGSETSCHASVSWYTVSFEEKAELPLTPSFNKEGGQSLAMNISFFSYKEGENELTANNPPSFSKEGAPDGRGSYAPDTTAIHDSSVILSAAKDLNFEEILRFTQNDKQDMRGSYVSEVIPAKAGIFEVARRATAQALTWAEGVIFGVGTAEAQTLPPTLIVSNMTYNAAGQVTQVNFGNGDVTTYTYNDLNLRLTQLKTVKTGGTVVQDLNYTYDAVGNILSITDNVGQADQTFQYDHLNRLTQATGENYGTKTYSYDVLGNITSKDGLTYTYDGIAGGPHAVTSLSDGTTFTYDANGNMATQQKGTDLKVFIYDAENRLIEVKLNGTTVESYEYDGDGGRTKKLPNSSTPNTKFIGQMYEEQGTRKTSYIFLGDQRIAAVTNGAILYFHGDHLGSANIVSDSTGTIKELSEYEPYGQFSRHEKYGTPEEQAYFYFTNQYLDETTSLYYYGARYYHPLIGRFIQADDLVPGPSNPQAFNRYSYVINNPLAYTDPSGHWLHLVVMAVVKFAIAHPVIFSGIASSIFNVATNPTAFSSLGNFVSSAAIGYAAGAVGYAAGGPVLGKLGTGLKGIVASAFVGGATAGFISGAATTVVQGGSLGEALKFGLVSAAYSAVTSAVIAGAGYGIAKAVQSIRQAHLAKVNAGTQATLGEKPNAPGRSLNADRTIEIRPDQELTMAKPIDPEFVNYEGNAFYSEARFSSSNGVNPLEGTTYTDKVLGQIKLADNHAFPNIVDNYAIYAKQTTFIGGDGIARIKLELYGVYRGNNGTFQWFIEQDMTINHRFFKRQ